MDFIDFKNKFKNQVLINSREIKLYEPNFNDSQLYRWQKKGHIKKITRANYIFSDLELKDHMKINIANDIYHPSYVSLEYAMNYHGLIPEIAFAITSVSTKKTYSITSPIGQFYYKQIKPSLYFGYLVEELDGVKYKIASIEKTFLDYLYLNPEIDNLKIVEDLRIDIDFFTEEFNKEKFKTYLERFQSKALKRRVEKILGKKYA